MAKYSVKFSCGHTETVDLVGKETDRQKKIAYYEESGECSECYKKRMKAAEEAALAKYTLPTLEGTEKQVAYAKSKIARFVRENGVYMDKAVKIIAELQKEETLKDFEARGMTVQQVLDCTFARSQNLKIAYTILTETNAGKVLDAMN